MEKLKLFYKNNKLVILGCLVVIPLTLGIFISTLWPLVIMNMIGLFAGIKFISIANTVKPVNISKKVPEYIEFEGEVYYRHIVQWANENGLYWSIEYKNLYGKFLPHMENLFTMVDYDNKISLEPLFDIIYDKLKEFNYV